MKICLHITEKLYTLNHLLEDILSKRKYFTPAKQLLLQNYFSRGGSRNPAKLMEKNPAKRWGTLQQDLTTCKR